MTTASQILTGAARTLGYLGRTEVLSAADASDALTCFNQMLDSWSNEALASYVTLERNFPLVVGQQSYTIGSGGNINSTRPYDIDSAYVRDANHLDFKMQVVAKDVWDSIGLKSNTSQIPQVLFYDSQYPLGIINIFPVPSAAYTVYFNSTLDQVTAPLLTTVITLPVGYELAYRLNLAVQMMSYGFPCMLGQPELGALVAQAALAKANIKKANTKEVLAEYDPALLGHGGHSYNIYRDS